MSQELIFVLVLASLLILLIITKLVHAGWLRAKNKKNEAQTREFYTKVEKQVEQNKKEK